MTAFGFYLNFEVAQAQLGEGYNVFAPYIDTEFAQDYTPAKFDLVKDDFTLNQVKALLGEPLFSFEDDSDCSLTLIYTNDGYLRRKGNREYRINDFAWYRSTIYFDSAGKMKRIDKGWSFD